MKKPKQKRIKQCLENIELNFSELIDAIISYEQHNMDDWAFEIIGEIERLPSKQILNLLFNDFINRSKTDLKNIIYKGLWYALFNVDQSQENTHEEIIFQLKNHKINNYILKFIKLLDEGTDSDGEINIRKILNQYNDS